MSQQVEGVVKRVFTKNWQDKTFYSLALTNQEGLFGFGPTNPNAHPGDKVTFVSKTNAKGYLEAEKGTLKVTKGVEEVRSNDSVGAVGASAVPSSYVSKDTYWANKEARDVINDSKRELGASRNTAIAFIDLLVKHEAIKLPAGAKREGFLVALLEDYTATFMGIEKDRTAVVEKAAKPAKKAEETEAAEDADDWQ
jgi:hypothetical protein